MGKNSTPRARNVAGLQSPYPKSPISAISQRFKVENGGTGFSRPVAVCFALNYVVGTGFLVLPYVFVQAGLILSVITVVASSVVADMSKDYVLVAMARAEYVLEEENKTTAACVGTLTASSGSDDSSWTSEENEPLLRELPAVPTNKIGETASKVKEGASANGHAQPGYRRYQSLQDARVVVENATQVDSPATSNYGNERKGNIIWGNKAHHASSVGTKPLVVKDRTIELSSLSDMFLDEGKVGLFIYTAFLSVYMYMMLWAYTSVFAQAMAASLRISYFNDYDNYTIYAIVFGAIVCPMSFVEVEDQVVVQISLTILRVARLLIMICTALFCPACFQNNADGISQEVPLFRPEGFHILLPIVIAANLMHEALPDLSAPCKDKRLLGQTFQWTFICTGLIYSILGVSVGLCFGQAVEPSANINWEAFQSPTGNSNEWAYQIVGYFVVISPAFDVISAYPLNAIALGNNLMEVRCGGSANDHEPSRFTRMTFRMIAAIPPMIGALFVRDLGVITDYAGTAGLAVTFCITSAIYIGSGRHVDRKLETYYDSYGTSTFWASVLLVFGIALVIFVLYELAT